MSELLLQYVLTATASVRLTPEDYEEIAREIRKGHKY